jgi:signal peptidase I
LNSKNKKHILKEFLSYLLVAIIGALFAITLRIFVIEPYIVPTPSMSPTLLIGDRVIVNKLQYKFKEVSRGDIVAVYVPEEHKDLVKRVIGLPYEELFLNNDGNIYINGKLLQEPYLPENTYYYENEYFKLGQNQYFLMGDNRNNSSDSRVFGPVKTDQIFGRVFFIYGPFSRIGKLY